MKIQISIPDEVATKIDQFCKEQNLKRSVVFQIATQQFINQREAVAAFNKMTEILEKIVIDGQIDEDSKKALNEMRLLANLLSANLGS